MQYTNNSNVNIRPHILSDGIKKEILCLNAVVKTDETLLSGDMLISIDAKQFSTLKLYKKDSEFTKDSFVFKNKKVYKALKNTSNFVNTDWEECEGYIFGCLNELYIVEDGTYSILIAGIAKNDAADEIKFAALKQNLLIL